MGAEEPVDALGRPLAAWGQRLGAFVIDELFIFVVTLCAAIAFGLRHTLAGALLSLVMAAAYYAVLNGSEAGQTFYAQSQAQPGSAPGGDAGADAGAQPGPGQKQDVLNFLRSL